MALEDEDEDGRTMVGCLKQGHVIINIKEMSKLLDNKDKVNIKEMAELLLDNVDDFKVAVRERSVTMVRGVEHIE